MSYNLINHKVATLLTDFGISDFYVGAMKGALLSVASDANIIDITHEIPPHDIQAGAWTLACAYEAFPTRTVHVAVVDPGVGSARRSIVVHAGEHLFVGPDNGLFTFIYKREHVHQVISLTNESYFRATPSRTFHGRDVFAPVAGALLNGVKPGELGETVTDYVQLPIAEVQRTNENKFTASIIHIDCFGNLVTNINRQIVDDERLQRGMRLKIRDYEVRRLQRFFVEEGTADGEVFAIWGSVGYLEIVARCASAAKILGVERGAQVVLETD